MPSEAKSSTKLRSELCRTMRSPCFVQQVAWSPNLLIICLHKGRVCVCVCVCVLLITNNEELHAATESETAPWALDESSEIQQTTHSHYATSRNSCPSIRDKIACDTERCRLHETLAQARPQNEVNSRPKRLAANRNSCFRISSPSVLIAPNVSNTIKSTKEIISAFKARVVLAMLLCSSIPLARILLTQISCSKWTSDCDIDCKTFAFGPSLDRDIHQDGDLWCYQECLPSQALETACHLKRSLRLNYAVSCVEQ